MCIFCFLSLLLIVKPLVWWIEKEWEGLKEAQMMFVFAVNV